MILLCKHQRKLLTLNIDQQYVQYTPTIFKHTQYSMAIFLTQQRKLFSKLRNGFIFSETTSHMLAVFTDKIVLQCILDILSLWLPSWPSLVALEGVELCLKQHSHFHALKFGFRRYLLTFLKFIISWTPANITHEMKVHKNKKDPSGMSSPNCVWVGSILDQGLTIKLRSVFLLRKGTSSSGHSGL